GHRLDGYVGDARRAEGRRRAAAGDQLVAELGQLPAQVDQALFVVDGQQDPHGRTPSAGSGDRRSSAGRASRKARMVRGYRRRSTILIRSWRVLSVSSGRTSTASWARIGPSSTISVATCTVQPVTLTPADRAAGTGW